MRFAVIALFCLTSHLLFSAENNDSTEIPRDRHPIISIGAGIQSGPSVKPGPVYTAGFEYPLNNGRCANLEFLLWQWNGKTTSGYGMSLVGRFFFISDSSDLRPFVHIGGAPWPLISWDVGAGVDYQFYHDFYLQFCARYITTVFQGLIDPSSGRYYPAMVTVSLRYKI